MGKILYAYVNQTAGATKGWAEFWLPAGVLFEYELISVEARKGTTADAIDLIWENAKVGSTTTQTKKRYGDGSDASSSALELYRGDGGISTTECIYAYHTGVVTTGDAASLQRAVPFVLLPGNGLLVAPANSGTPVEVSTIWDERPLGSTRSWIAPWERFDPPLALGVGRGAG